MMLCVVPLQFWSILILNPIEPTLQWFIDFIYLFIYFCPKNIFPSKVEYIASFLELRVTSSHKITCYWICIFCTWHEVQSAYYGHRILFPNSPSAFPRTCELFFILRFWPLEQYCGLPGEEQLECAQSTLAILSPACARRLLARKTLLSSLGKLSPCSRASNFF